MTDLDPWVEFAGLDLSEDERAALLKPWRTIAAEIAKLRSLDLTDIHPAIVFDPTSGWPE
jgi:hypothetical protein